MVLQRVHQEQLDEAGDIRKLDAGVTRSLSELDLLTGKWTNVDYFDHKRINPSWLPILDKMRKMTLAYVHPESAYYGNSRLWDAINKSLAYFSNHERSVL